MPRDVVVIGGGLTGLAAAYELERLKIPYTLIEVKGRLGGSLNGEVRDGFVMDGGEMVLPFGNAWKHPLVESTLRDLELDLALYPAAQAGCSVTDVAFTRGTFALTDALASRLNGAVNLKMAVTSLGRLDDRYTVCLENGFALTADALIIAAPARYAERMFRTLQQEVAYRLLDYRYDNVLRVTLGYRREDIGEVPDADDLPIDYPVTHIHWTDNPRRVPEGCVLVQVGVRYEPSHGKPQDPVGELAALMGWSQQPLVERVDEWATGFPNTAHRPEHDANINAIDCLLPDGVALVGSDYRARTVPERIQQGREAARRVAQRTS